MNNKCSIKLRSLSNPQFHFSKWRKVRQFDKFSKIWIRALCRLVDESLCKLFGYINLIRFFGCKRIIQLLFVRDGIRNNNVYIVSTHIN